MKFAKGHKVEVFSKREVSTGSWRQAEVISGDGHNYTVKYDKFAFEPVIGWVSRKAIRPRPPFRATNWVSGDIVEVFDNFSWKLGTILKGLGQKLFLIELHGSLVNILVSFDEIRVRHYWQDGEWIAMGKQCLNYEDGKHCEMRTGLTHKLKNSSPYRPSEWEYSAKASRKFRRVEKEGQSHCLKANPSGEHVYTMPSQCHMNGKKHRRSSLIIKFPVTQRSESSQSVESLSFVRSDSNDEASDQCSVGSCSSTDSWTPSTHYDRTDNSNGDISDAHSSCAPSHVEEYTTLESLEKTAAATIHQLELQGYRHTLRTLHAAGPLSWEQQSLISNLRLSLNISNDEHLLEIKSLLST